ncbi:hypothetical protein Adt_13849 [Abeliophyllum distichum]|uniref:Uncharacterized protein n=1 Tax=Abeliophyllum distichum TaxID=126358 RepID=A0ABD1TXZ5_9LAMI
MSGFYFTKIHAFKIRCGRVLDEKPRVVRVEGTPLEPIVFLSVEVAGDASSDLSSMSVVPIPVEMVGDFFSIPLWGHVTCSSGRRSHGGGEARADLRLLSSNSTINLSTSIPSQGKGEGDIRSCEVPKRRLLEEGAGVDSGGAKKSQTAPLQETFGSNQAPLLEVGELRSQVEGSTDIEALHLEVKNLSTQLAVSKDTRARAEYDIVKSSTIQRMCILAQRKAESQLQSCQKIIQDKDRKLTKALEELSRVKDLLANQTSLSCSNPKDPSGS